MIFDGLQMPTAEFERGSGWTLKPEGACRAEMCVPLAGPVGEVVDVPAVAEQLGMPVVHDVEEGMWSLGPAFPAGHALSSAEAPELELPDLDGNLFRLSSLRGKKVLLVAWAPY